MITRTLIQFLPAACIMVGAGLAAMAQGREEIDRRQIVRAVGESTTTAEADQAAIDIGVVTEAKTAQEAAAENARKVDKVLAALRSIVGSTGTIRTSNYSINPNYAPPREGVAPAITGYIVSNTVEVRTGNLTSVGKLIDAAIKNEANNVNRVQFTLRDQTRPMTMALHEATLKARTKAEAIANALDMKLIRVISVEEGGNGPVPVMMQNRMMDGAFNTQIEAGMIDVRAMVVLTAEIGP